MFWLPQVAFSRDKLNGELVVDGTDQNAGSAAGSSQFINVEMPYYIGGVTSDIAQGGAKNLEVSTRYNGGKSLWDIQQGARCVGGM